MSQHLATWLIATAVALTVSALPALLDGPDDIATAQAVAEDATEAQQDLAALERYERAVATMASNADWRAQP